MGVQRALRFVGAGAPPRGSGCNAAPPWRVLRAPPPQACAHTGPSEPRPALQTRPKDNSGPLSQRARTWGGPWPAHPHRDTHTGAAGVPSSGTPARQSVPSPTAGAQQGPRGRASLLWWQRKGAGTLTVSHWRRPRRCDLCHRLCGFCRRSYFPADLRLGGGGGAAGGAAGAALSLGV